MARDRPRNRNFFGNFLCSEKWAYLVRPPRTKPDAYMWPPRLPDLVWVAKTEEKGSDVNLACHLVRDAYLNVFDPFLLPFGEAPAGDADIMISYLLHIQMIV